MDIREELKNTLFQLGLENPQFEFEVTPTGKIGGFIISQSFLGKTQIERQNMIWDMLDRIFDTQKRLKIIGLLTMTPDEVEEANWQ